MSITSNLVLNLSAVGGGLVEQYAVTITNATSPASQQNLALTTGFNSISVPTGSVGVILVPPSTNTEALTLKGITGDTGQPISPTQPTALSLVSGASTVGITAAGAVTVLAVWF